MATSDDAPIYPIHGEPLVGAEQVADMLGIARSTVYEWSRVGVLPSVVLRSSPGRTVRRWRRIDIERFIEASCQPASLLG